MFKKKQQGETEAQQAARSPGKGFKPFLKRNWKRIAAGAVVLVVAGAFLMPRQASPASTSVSYLQDTPQRRSITNVFSDSGTITAANTYEVKPLVRGTVLTADFQEGDMVQAGDVLYTIDSSDAANSVARAQLSLNQAQRSYEGCGERPVCPHRHRGHGGVHRCGPGRCGHGRTGGSPPSGTRA